MAILDNDPLTQIAFSVCENKGVFALLLGSGLSRAAGIPTGWEITLDLIRRVALAKGIDEQADWAKWHRDEFGSEPDYSALLEELAASSEECRSILQSYIEPTDEEREEGLKVPTPAHHAVADLVRDGHVRVIVTTNFDRLTENALRERDVEPTIVSSADALKGAEPITHSDAYILKLHGDYKDARILNTETELSGYPAEYDRLLDRIFDEHGLIVCGWSGEWDHALRDAFLRAPNRRYSTFWTARGDLGGGAKDLTAHRRAKVVKISDADAFFSTLRQRVATIEQYRRQNPQSIDALVGSAKRFLTKGEFRIQLDDLVAKETERLIEKLDAANLSPQGPWEQDEFRSRVKFYEGATEPIASIAGVLGRWGDGHETELILDVIRTLFSHAEKEGSGLIAYLGLRSYPAVLILTAYGIGATRAQRWSALRAIFNGILHREHRESLRTVECLFLWAWKGGEQNAFQQLEGLERRHTPLSDHLCAVFTDWSRRFAGLMSDFESLFERYELLGSLAYLEKYSKDDVRETLAQNPMQGFAWMPVGRIGWHSETREKLIAEFQSERFRAPIIKSGFAHGDPEFLDLFIENFGRAASKMRW